MKRKSVKKAAAILLSSAMLLSVVPTGVFAEEKKQPEVTLYSEAAALFNVTTGEMIYEKNADKKLSTGALTQIMTLAIASEDKRDGKVKDADMVTISKNAWAAKLKGNVMFLEVGREFAFGELVKGVAVVSGNDASVAIAEKLNGTEEKFLARMNEKAASLGMKDTKFLTVNGMSKDSQRGVTTATDVAKLSSYYLKTFPENLKIHSLETYTTDTGRGEIKQSNANTSTGYTGAATLKSALADDQYHMVAVAERKGIKFVAVALNSASDKERTIDTKKLFDFGFAQYKQVKFNEEGEFISSIPVYYSPTKKTKVVVAETLEVTLHEKQVDQLKEEIVLPGYLKAPLKKGDIVGTKNIYIGDKLVHTIDLTIEEDLDSVATHKKIFHFLGLSVKWLQNLVFGD